MAPDPLGPKSCRVSEIDFLQKGRLKTVAAGTKSIALGHLEGLDATMKILYYGLGDFRKESPVFISIMPGA